MKVEGRICGNSREPGGQERVIGVGGEYDQSNIIYMCESHNETCYFV
jgi:hypothetical protein